MDISTNTDNIRLGVDVKTHVTGCVVLGDKTISMTDFAEIVLYVMTNTDLEVNDPRLELIEGIKSLKITDGYHYDSRRLR